MTAMSCLHREQNAVTRSVSLYLDESALQHNVSVLRARTPGSRVLAMVKANAYGHGAVMISRWLEQQVEALGVATMAEAAELRQAGIKQPVVLMQGVMSSAEMQQAITLKLDLVVHNVRQLFWLEQARDFRGSVWLKFNTGMSRLGFDWRQAPETIHRAKQLSGLRELVLMTHLACADEPAHPLNAQQWQRFQQLSAGTGLACSVANSAAILSSDDMRLDWVRPGIALYGSSPLAQRSAVDLDLRPVMTLRASVLALQSLQAGATVGYGARWQAERDTRIAVVGVGYGDGYPRHAQAGTPVAINGRIYPLAGRVSMDMITVDIGPEATAEPVVQPGDAVELWGAQVPVDQVAAQSGTISYELFCRLSGRVDRV